MKVLFSVNNIGRINVSKDMTILESLKTMDEKIALRAIAAEILSMGNKKPPLKKIVDLSFKLTQDTEVNIITSQKDRESRDILNHSTAHVMAAAIKELFKDVKFAIGPSISDGFYYDFDLDENLSNQDFPKIEKIMKDIITSDYSFERKEISKEEAKELFKDNAYKIELINEIPGDTVITYRSGNFIDLCSGPHIPSTSKIGAFKLLSTAGAYWRGNEKNKMLVRVYGTAFFNKEDLKNYLEIIEKAKQSDHRKIGKDLDLFSFHDEAPGFPFFHPNGMMLKNVILDYWREEHYREGYREINTPIILSEELWRNSGHWDHYKENMYFVKIDENNYAVKPMNCPGTIIVYKSNQHSYREFPIRYAELGLVHRHEKSGVLHGLFRVRNFTQDDAHIFCMEYQIKDEILKIIDLIDRMYKVFGFDNYHLELSTRPEKSIGSDQMWNNAENILKTILDNKNIDYVINQGEGAFYGPKIDFHIEDCLQRTWQCATIQLDFAMPEKFNIEYAGEDNSRHRPVMIHRVVLGSVERFMGILIEHYAGKFPPWLAPIQAIILPISDKYYDYAKKILLKLSKNGCRVEIDGRIESLNKKIRHAELRKIPYMVILGQNEKETETITIRKKEGEDIKELKIESFLESFNKVIRDRDIEY